MMKQLIKLSFLLITAVLCYSFAYKTSDPVHSLNVSNTDTTSRPPAFKDGGKTIDSLKRAYNCKAIEFENWEDDDATDSSLTVCLINSNIKASISLEKDHQLLTKIAAQIKKSLAKPENYNSYYIIFVTEEGEGFMNIRSHTLGGEIPSKLL